MSSVVPSITALCAQLDELRAALALGQASPVQAACELTTVLVELLTAVSATPAHTVAAYPWRQLRRERGWSQRDVYRRLTGLAAQRGIRLPDWPAFKRNLSRWESGAVAVSPFYRELLGSLFQLRPDTAPPQRHLAVSA
jgi:hypothetical protein